MTSSGWVSPDCTLPSAEQPLRVAEFDALFDAALLGATRTSDTSLLIELTGPDDVVRDLAARESECCSFFTFDIVSPTTDLVTMRISVPAAHSTVLDALELRLARP